MRDGFETFSPGIQWEGDGTAMEVHLGPYTVTCSVEFLVDCTTAAITGASVRPTEDATAVVEAFQDAVEATGDAPVALLLDNKPSNFAHTVVDAVGATLLLCARPYTPHG